ncbi:hypothetical protein [Indiicoccus explosivorum]|uniref:hypothetical protein n=1 Tax=Indiicoccus explosivorum TaxID=1917864 RepID=UPI000B431B55|nr:hypothetical protein [Indiicoccus explosivorum]
MAPKDPKRRKEDGPDETSPYDETALDDLVAHIPHSLRGAVDPDEEQDRPEDKDAADDYYRPFQNMPETGADDVPEEEKIQQDRRTDEKRVDRNRDDRV